MGKRTVTSNVLTRPCKFIWRVCIELKIFKCILNVLLGIILFCAVAWVAVIPTTYMENISLGTFILSYLFTLFIEVLLLAYVGSEWDTIKEVWRDTK